MTNKLIALLPMKGHSERVPNKNLKNFHGAPLYHTIMKTLLSSKYIKKVAIDTDSETIKEDSQKNFRGKVIIIDRPEAIQGDFVSMNEIIKYDLSILSNYNYFIQTHSTNPLLSPETLNNAIEKIFKIADQFDSLFSVTRFQTRFYWKNGEAINHNPDELIRTQDLPIIYEENSNFYIFSRDSFTENSFKRIGKRPYLFEVDKIEAIDIDEPEDFVIAEQIKTLKHE